VPGLIGVIALLIGLIVTALSVARERELGTFDQLMVSPLRIHEILIGKMVPPFIIGMINGSVYLVVAPLVFGVPFTGSLLLFWLSLGMYLLALIGLGMLISAASQTQQQAFLGAFAVLLPFALLSGFATPVENMPLWLQFVTNINPLAHMLRLMQGLFLKDASITSLAHSLGKLGLIALFTVTTSVLIFRRRAS